jgi:hypothetical protein
VPHATLADKLAREEMWWERARATGDRGIELEKTLETQGVLNIKRRRVTFVLDYFFVSREGE